MKILLRACSWSLLGGLLSTGCGSSTSTPSPVTLLDVTFALPAGKNCTVAGVTNDFTGTANTRVAILATGTGLTMGMVLYAPDFATQLVTASGTGTASINTTLTQTGTHHVGVCEVNGLGGNVRLTVTQQP